MRETLKSAAIGFGFCASAVALVFLSMYIFAPFHAEIVIDGMSQRYSNIDASDKEWLVASRRVIG